MRYKRTISTTLTPEDYEYCKNNRLQFSDLIRQGIRAHQQIGDINAEKRAAELLQKIHKLQAVISAQAEFMGKHEARDGKPLIELFMDSNDFKKAL